MRRKYTDEHVQFIANNITGRCHKEVAALFNNHFGTNIPASKIMSLAYRHGLKNGRDCRILAGELAAGKGKEFRFKKGHPTWNKGLKGVNLGGQETQFRKGNRPKNYMPVGSERINTDGYIDVKIADPGTWRQKHLLIWEQENGPVPKGHVVIFADGNPLNVVLENLLLITRGELVVMNKRGLISNDPDLTKAGVTVADIIMKVVDRKNKKREGKS